ncbi:MAG: GLPGLI family protein [Bacteroidales bacterium]|nr:GLPGLI family protein [Bacteroidales bacterium]
MRNLAMILFIVLSLNATAQLFKSAPEILMDNPKLKIIYKYQYHKDSTNPERISHRTMWLIVGDSLSLFVDPKKLWYKEELKKIFSVEQLQEWSLNNPNSSASEGYRIVKNRKTQNLIYCDYILGIGHLKYEEAIQLNWEMTEDTAHILGYPVQRAVTAYGGRKWEAWFSPAIAISDGPYKFMGLPGLILMMQDSQQHFVFEAVSVEEPAPGDFIGIEDVRYTIMSRERFLKESRKLIEDFINHPAALQLPREEDRLRVVENLKSLNNPIELK